MEKVLVARETKNQFQQNIILQHVQVYIMKGESRVNHVIENSRCYMRGFAMENVFIEIVRLI